MRISICNKLKAILELKKKGHFVLYFLKTQTGTQKPQRQALLLQTVLL